MASDLQKQSPTFQATANPGKLNTSFWESAFKKDEAEAAKPKKKGKVNLYGKSFYDDKDTSNTNQPAEKPETVIITDSSNNDDNKQNLIEIRGKCIASGCKCHKYVENTSKWSKGKCNTCDHAPATHKTQWINPNSPRSPYSPYSPQPKQPLTMAPKQTEPEIESEPEPEPEPEAMDNLWGTEFTNKLNECVSNTFVYNEQSILPAKYLLHYLKKRVGFNFSGQTQHRDALQYVLIELFGWKVIDNYGYKVGVVEQND